MSKRVSFFTLVILMMLVGFKANAEDEKSAVYTKYVAEVTSAFLKEVYQEYGFRCGGSGGSMPYDVEKISVSLDANQSATVDQARELVVKLTERFVQIINAHEKIRPFLREYPFPSSRARVMISFSVSKKKINPSSDNEVELVFHAKKRIYYQAHNYDNPFLGKDIKDEPYEEALKIVKTDVAKKETKQPFLLEERTDESELAKKIRELRKSKGFSDGRTG